MPFLADLVTLADPTSPYSFLNYLHEQGRLYRFYFHERFHVLRREFEAYCRWVAARLASCRFGHRVDAIRPVDGRLGGVGARRRAPGASAVVLGVGCVPVGAGVRARADALARATWPSATRRWRARLGGRDRLRPERGRGLRRPARARRAARLDWFTRSAGFLPMEYSKLGLEHFSPEYTAYFHALPEARRDALRAGQDLLYKGIDAGTSERIYDLLYRRSVDGAEPDVRYAARCELRGVERPPPAAPAPARPGRRLHPRRRRRGPGHGLRAGAAAGARATCWRSTPPAARWSSSTTGCGCADGSPSTLFVQNAELHTHGVGDAGPRARRAPQRGDRQRAVRARGLRRCASATSSSPSARRSREPRVTRSRRARRRAGSGRTAS